VDAAQCTRLHEADVSAVEVAQGLEPGSLTRFGFTCEADAAMGGPPRCLMTCETSDDCEAGSDCLSGRCVMGPIPPPDCVAPLQRYEARAGDAYSVVGSETGYLHRWEAAPDGSCVEDVTRSELLTGRFHRDEPVCGPDSLVAISPNPCRFEGLEEPVGSDAGIIQLRDTWAIRFRSVGLTFDVVDVAIPMPNDPGQFYSPIPAGYAFSFVLQSGFEPRVLNIRAAYPERIRTEPDGTLWILDSGDDTRAGTRGQVIHFTTAVDGVDGYRLN
jgi:hypothetical protein